MRKNADGSFTLLVASTSKEPPKSGKEPTPGGSNIQMIVEYGDFADALTKSAAYLKEAKKYAANDNQRNMLEGYASR